MESRHQHAGRSVKPSVAEFETDGDPAGCPPAKRRHSLADITRGWSLNPSYAGLDALVENLTWLRVYMFIHVACRATLMVAEGTLSHRWVGGALLVCCALGLAPAWRRLALYLVGVILSVLFVSDLPYPANHSYLELIVIGFLILLQENAESPPGREEARLLDSVIRWILLIVITAGGLQKLFYVHYADGTFLAWVTAREDRFAEVLRLVIPTDEFHRLRGLGLTEGAGPFRVDSALFLLLSNLVVWIEVLVPPLLLFRASRTWAALGLIGFVVGIELGAREVIFGALIIVLLSLQLPGRRVKPFVIGLASLYVWLVAAACGMLPGPAVNP
jgi:hypothetical protein